MAVKIGTEFWLMSVKTDNGAAALEQCKKAVTGFACACSFNIPELKVGTLDSLMALSDELTKHDVYVETLAKRLAHLMLDLANHELAKAAEWLYVHDHPMDDYARRFRWDSARYPVKQSLKNIVEVVLKLVSQVDSDLTSKSAHFSNIRSSLTTIEKRNSGTLLTRSLNRIVKKEDFLLNSTYMTTVLVVVPKNGFKSWLAEYEKLAPMVVPRSSRLLYEDNEAGLMSAIIFKKSLTEFRQKALDKKWSVRDFDFNEEQIKKEKQEYVKLLSEKERLFGTFIKWLRVNFGDIFSAWLHIKALRIFVESVLRYGLPVNFQAIILEPTRKHHKKLRQVLHSLYANMERKGIDVSFEDLKLNDDSLGAALSQIDPGVEYFPYVSLTFKTALLDTTDVY